LRKHALEEIVNILNEQTVAVGIARAAYFAKKAEKRNLEARLKKAALGRSQAEKVMLADATDEWLQFEKRLNRLEAEYDFQRDKLEVLNKEYQAQYLEIKDHERAIRKQVG
jgi:uracil-DNA glycosylase